MISELYEGQLSVVQNRFCFPRWCKWLMSLLNFKQQSPSLPHRYLELFCIEQNIPVSCGRMFFFLFFPSHIAPFSCQYRVYTATQRVWPKDKSWSILELSTHSRIAKLEFGDRLIITCFFKECRMYKWHNSNLVLAAFQQSGLVLFCFCLLFLFAFFFFFTWVQDHDWAIKAMAPAFR